MAVVAPGNIFTPTIGVKQENGEGRLTMDAWVYPPLGSAALGAASGILTARVAGSVHSKAEFRHVGEGIVALPDGSVVQAERVAITVDAGGFQGIGEERTRYTRGLLGGAVTYLDGLSLTDPEIIDATATRQGSGAFANLTSDGYRQVASGPEFLQQVLAEASQEA